MRSTLCDFIASNREEVLARARLRVAARDETSASGADEAQGLPVFLDQLQTSLERAGRQADFDHSELKASASVHGGHLFHQGLSVSQVVNAYGDICQVVTALAIERNESIASDEFQTLNLCLDDATAGAVTAFSQHRERAIASAASAAGTERLGVLAHDMRNLLSTAMLSFGIIQKGNVSPGGSTGAVHARTLTALNSLIDRSLADVRLDSGMQNVQRIAVREVIEEVAIGAVLIAQARGRGLIVINVDATITVDADRQILAAAIANLVQNAFKFTRRGSTVTLRASSTTTRVLVEIEDECGGLPPGKAEELLQPFSQRGTDLTGLGLGLSICLKAAKSMGGELVIRDVPGKGCVFALDLPKQPPPPTSIFDHPKNGKSDQGGSIPGAAGRSGSS